MVSWWAGNRPEDLHEPERGFIEANAALRGGLKAPVCLWGPERPGQPTAISHYRIITSGRSLIQKPERLPINSG